MNFKKKKLPNGLKIIFVPTKGYPSATAMVLVKTGSNYEKKSENGLSHFLEHMVFKGTTKRPSIRQISQELDSIGAYTNAFTSNELTAYFAKADKRYFKKILDVVSDMYLDPLLPAPELEKERGVILQEISMYEDLPQRKVGEILVRLLYGEVPAGRPVIGPRENIKRFTRKDFINYRKKHYVAEKTVVIVAGDLNERQIFSEVEKLFSKIPRGKVISKDKVKESQKKPTLAILKKKTDQTHMIFAFRSVSAGDKRVPALDLLSAVLGRGMSSRLWQKMREDLGACYYVRAVHYTYTDHGVFIIPIGIEAKRSEEVIRAVLDECKRLALEKISEEELTKAKEYILGQMYMGLETSDSLAEFYAEDEVTTGRLQTPQDKEKAIRKLTSEDIRRVAKGIFQNNNLNLAIVGDIKGEKKIKSALRFE